MLRPSGLKIKKRKSKSLPMTSLKIPGMSTVKEKRASISEMLAMITLGMCKNWLNDFLFLKKFR